MITGFNTDVRHRDVVFHVQTEDKGTGNPCIESLVYVGGQILARKRAGYRSLLEGDAATKAVSELMESQHRSMIEEIRSGKMDDKVPAIKGGPPKAEAPRSTEVAPPPGPLPPKPVARPPVEATPERAVKAPVAAPAEPAPSPPAVSAAAAEPALKPEPAPVAEPPVEATTAVPRKMPPLPPKPPPRRPPPPPIQRPPAGPTPSESADRSLDQVILDYLEMESGQNKLVLSMDRTSGELVSGSEAALKFRTESSVDADPIGQTLITVRLISTFNEPQLLAEGRTDDAGELRLKISIPDLQTGSGALIINAESSIGNAEIRHLI